jgi:hypothetical protein
LILRRALAAAPSAELPALDLQTGQPRGPLAGFPTFLFARSSQRAIRGSESSFIEKMTKLGTDQVGAVRIARCVQLGAHQLMSAHLRGWCSRQLGTLEWPSNPFAASQAPGRREWCRQMPASPTAEGCNSAEDAAVPALRGATPRVRETPAPRRNPAFHPSD